MDHVETTTTYGRLRGIKENGLAVFRGVPFASPPVGPLRFAPPQPPARWDGTREATAYSTASVQPPMQAAGMFGRMFGAGELPVGEDCLYLNVWTPACDDAKRPVMVWIHGGGFNMGTGSSPLYDGSHLARRGDVVVVSINYRLGILGFFWTPGFNEANAGLLDQVAALRWVRDEIAAFGGDAGNVTIFGESAGGKSVECVLAMPSSTGLVHRAVAQSTYAPSMDPQAAIDRSAAILKELGIVPADVASIRERPLDEILQAANTVQMAAMATAKPGALPAGTSPVVDGSVIPSHPLDAVASGIVRDVPLIVGTTADEGRLFSAFMPGGFELPEDQLLGRLKNSLPGADDALAQRAADVYRASLQARGAPHAPADIASAAQTDAMFRQHSIALAEAQARADGPVWMYLFDWLSTGLEGRLRSCHGLEIPFVMGTLDTPLGELAGSGEHAEELAGRMMDTWISFARTGTPSVRGAPEWPAYDPSRRATMVFGEKTRVEEAPLEDERLLWEPLTNWR